MARFLVCLLLIGSILVDRPAWAQVVQPQYVRPSKGSVITIDSKTQSSAGTIFTSAAYDMTAFTAVTFSAKFASAAAPTQTCTCPSAPCQYQLTVGIYESTSKTGPFGGADGTILGPRITGAELEPVLSTPVTLNVSNPYAKFFFNIVGYFDSTGTPVVAQCTATVSVTPIPFTNRVIAAGGERVGGPIPLDVTSPVLVGGSTFSDPAGGIGDVALMRINALGVAAVGGGRGSPLLPLTSPVPVAASPGAATLVFTADNRQSGVTLQNVGTVPLYCAVGESAGSLSATRFNFVLGAGLATNDGTGGSKDVEQVPFGQSVYCLGNGGAGSIAYTPY